jgi:hypothetical protein
VEKRKLGVLAMALSLALMYALTACGASTNMMPSTEKGQATTTIPTGTDTESQGQSPDDGFATISEKDELEPLYPEGFVMAGEPANVA